jgi:uncharacterized membrane-anchored protein
MALKAASAVGLSLLALSFGAACAQQAAAPPADPQRAAEDRQINAAAKAGPADITLHDEAVLHLPKDEVFVPAKEATILMRRMGNFSNDSLLGVIFPSKEGGWFVAAEYDDTGFVKDEEGKDIDADKLLQSMKDNQEQANKERRENGKAPLRITRWIEPPHYDKASHHLVWSIELQALDSKGGVTHTNLNYNTYALGRAGYITFDLVTGVDTVEKNKAYVRELLSNLTFNKGKRYEDFNVSTDKIAEYGLLALIGGVAVKKLGLLALAGVFFLKFAKIIAAAAIAGFVAFKKFFRRKGDEAVHSDMRGAPDAPVSPPSDPPTIVS